MFLLRNVSEKKLACIVRCDSRGQDDSRPSIWPNQTKNGFSENGVGVDVAFGGERKAVALAEEFADAVGGVDGGDELGVQGWVVSW